MSKTIEIIIDGQKIREPVPDTHKVICDYTSCRCHGDLGYCYTNNNDCPIYIHTIKPLSKLVRRFNDGECK